MPVVAELDEEPSPDDSDLQDPDEVRAGIVWFSVAMAGCVMVVVIVVLLLVVHPSQKPAQKPASLCWDSGMQMEMPCSPSP